MALATPISRKTSASDSEYEENDSHAGRSVTEAEYWEKYYDSDDIIYEWNNGVLEEKPVSDYAQYTVYLWFQNLLRDFLYVTNMGRMMGLELGFRISLPDQKTAIRKPDLAVVASTNPVPLGDKDPSYQGIFDICIESLSTTNKRNIERDTVTKHQEYQGGGVKEYYILDERELETGFFALNQSGIYAPLPITRGIVSSQVLPGFRFRVDDLYHKPEPPEMVDDPIYRDFVSPFLRAERLQTRQATLKAEQQEIRANEQEVRANEQKARADRYEAMLRAAGINIDDVSSELPE